MIPYLVIGVSALIGLLGWGLKGLILGAVGGWILNMVFGTVLMLASGGLVPRKVRKQAASRFIALYGDLARGAFPDALESALQKSVERSIEAIFKRAASDNRSMDLNAALSRAAIQDAAGALIAEEQGSEMRTFLIKLEEHIEREMYP